MAVKFDYQSVYNRLVDRMQKLSGDADVLTFGSTGLFLSDIAEVVNQLAQYNDYWTREAIYSTARNISSVMGQVKVRGYKPKRAAGSVGFCVFSTNPDFVNARDWNIDYSYVLGDKVLRSASETDDTIRMYECIAATSTGEDPRTEVTKWAYVNCKYANASITIPKRTRVTGAGLTFVTTHDAVLEPTMDYVVASIRQGTPKTRYLDISSTTGGFKIASLTDTNIDHYFYSVLVDGEEYDEVDNIYWAGAGNKMFQIDTLPSMQGIQLTFGNGTFGFSPVSNLVEFRYIETAGLNGEVNRLNVIKTVADTISTIVNGVSVDVPIYCTNISTCSGSANMDTIEDIKIGGITTYQSQNRAITQNDYQTLLNGHSLIEQCVVWGSYEDYEDSNSADWDTWVQMNDNKIHIAAYTPSGENLNAAAKAELMNYLYDKKSSLDVLVFEDVEFIGLAFTSLAYISTSGYTKEAINAAITSYLSSSYDISKMEFKRPLYDTVWKGGLNQIAGISHHTSSVKLIKETGFDVGTFQLNTHLPFDNVSVSSYELWVQDNAADNPSFIQAGRVTNNEWVWLNGFTASGSGRTSIDQFRATGEVEVSGNIQRYVNGVNVLLGRDPKDFTLRIYYNLGTDTDGQYILDVVPTGRNQILKFVEMRAVASVYE